MDLIGHFSVFWANFGQSKLFFIALAYLFSLAKENFCENYHCLIM